MKREGFTAMLILNQGDVMGDGYTQTNDASQVRKLKGK